MTTDFMTVVNMYGELYRHYQRHTYFLKCKTSWVGDNEYTEVPYENGIQLKAVFLGTDEYFQVTDDKGEVLVDKFTGPYSIFYDTSKSTYSLSIHGGDGLVVVFYEESGNFLPDSKPTDEAHTEVSDLLEKIAKLERKIDKLEVSTQENIRIDRKSVV